ncbi:MAG: hypothetical protein QOI56_907, partial [Actinomycetota bacterium]|nr:hypothetical protein [Actinomycetota bacterium]
MSPGIADQTPPPGYDYGVRVALPG